MVKLTFIAGRSIRYNYIKVKMVQDSKGKLTHPLTLQAAYHIVLDSTSVLVIGGGLVGLSSALFLAWQGVPTILIEKHPGSSPHPRAIGYTHRTMELLRAVGIEDKIPRAPAHFRLRRTKVESLAGKWFEETSWTKEKTQQQQQQVRSAHSHNKINIQHNNHYQRNMISYNYSQSTTTANTTTSSKQLIFIYRYHSNHHNLKLSIPLLAQLQ